MKLEEILNIKRLKFQHSTNSMDKSLGGLPSPNVHFGEEKNNNYSRCSCQKSF